MAEPLNVGDRVVVVEAMEAHEDPHGNHALDCPARPLGTLATIVRVVTDGPRVVFARVSWDDGAPKSWLWWWAVAPAPAVEAPG